MALATSPEITIKSGSAIVTPNPNAKPKINNQDKDALSTKL